MKKVYIKRKINEDINITDPTLAQQYLAVKKQMADKRMKRDQSMKTVNQIDNEINILEKNLIAIETKAMNQGQKTLSTTQTQSETQQQGEQEKTNESLNENSIDDFRENVISIIDDEWHDGETLVWEFEDLLSSYYKKGETVENTANAIIEIDVKYRDDEEKLNLAKKSWKLNGESFIGGDTLSKLAISRATPTVVKESIYKKGMTIDVNGKKMYIDNVENFRNDLDIVHTGGDTISSKWLDRQDVKILSKPDNRSWSQKQKSEERISEQIETLEDELNNLKQERKNIEIDMEADLANYDEMTYIPEENPRYSISSKDIERKEMPHDVWGTKLNKVDQEIERVENKLRKLYNHRDCPYKHKEYSVNESVYEDMVDNIEKELNKLSDIKNYIENWDVRDQGGDEIQTSIMTRDDLAKFSGQPLTGIMDLKLGDEDPDFEDFEDFGDDDYTVNVDIKRDDFIPNEDEKIVDETLKAEDKKPWVPNLLEDEEELETELDMMNYEFDDQPKDEYVFHVKINPDTDEEIIAKFYKDDEDDDWTVRVVKGDDAIQDMQFDIVSYPDKIEIKDYLARIYGDVMDMDPKEYEYLLDDKEKIDAEYYEV